MFLKKTRSHLYNFKILKNHKSLLRYKFCNRKGWCAQIETRGMVAYIINKYLENF